MEFKFQFLHVDVSQALQDYCQDQFGQFGKRLLKGGSTLVTFSKRRHICSAQVDVRSPWGHFKAVASADSFYAAADIVAEKIEKQILKRKNQLQNHKKLDLSKTGKLLHLNPLLEYEASGAKLGRLRKSA